MDEFGGETESEGPGRNSSPSQRSCGAGYGVVGAVEITQSFLSQVEIKRDLLTWTYFIAEFILSAVLVGENFVYLQSQLVTVFDSTRLLVHVFPLLKLWSVVPPIDWCVLEVPSCHVPNVVLPIRWVDPLKFGEEPE